MRNTKGTVMWLKMAWKRRNWNGCRAGMRHSGRLIMTPLEDRCVPTVYSLTNLGTLPGGALSNATAINNVGQVTGSSSGTGTGGSHAFLYNGGPLQDLGTLTTVPNVSSSGRAINIHGHVAGTATALVGGQSLFNHAFVYSNGTMQDLGVLGSQTRSIATGINDNGVAVGYSFSQGAFQNTLTRAFVSSNGAITDIGTLGGSAAFATGINNAAHIVGYSTTISGGYEHAFVYQNGVMTDLGTLAEPTGSPPAPPLQGTYSFARAINANGLVVGSSQLNTNGNIDHAVMFTGNSVIDLGTLGGLFSAAYAVNDGGTIVGSSNTAPPAGATYEPQHAFVYSGGVMEDLNDLLDSTGAGWILGSANGINDQGQIVGSGFDPNGQIRAFLLTPAAPVPGVQSMMVNDGTVQRSQVSSLQVTLGQTVTLPPNAADAFSLTRQGDGAAVTLSALVNNSGPTTVVTLSFDGGAVHAGSLADGRYTLTARAAQINSGNFDGNGDGTIGDDYVLVGTPANGLFRMFGDVDGDGTVAAAEFVQFRLAFGASNTLFDFDGDGVVVANDFVQFRLRFGGSI